MIRTALLFLALLMVYTSAFQMNMMFSKPPVKPVAKLVAKPVAKPAPVKSVAKPVLKPAPKPVVVKKVVVPAKKTAPAPTGKAAGGKEDKAKMSPAGGFLASFFGTPEPRGGPIKDASYKSPIKAAAAPASSKAKTTSTSSKPREAKGMLLLDDKRK